MAGKVMTPSELNVPAFMMHFPFTVSNREPNNVLMAKGAEPYDLDRAFRQWMQLYNTLAAEALVYLLPHDGYDYQDLTFVANVGAYLPHLVEPQILLAKFKSEPRQGEDDIADHFFDTLGYDICQSPAHWEGEADLKFIRDNLYVAGYGIRSDIKSYRWMADRFGMRIVSVAMTDPKLYHFDCLFFPMDERRALVATSALDSADVRAIEDVMEIIEVPKRFVHDGWTNSVRLNDKWLVNVPPTKESRDALEDLVVRLGFDPVMINLGEFDKSGADLSCLVLHLNHNGRK